MINTEIGGSVLPCLFSCGGDNEMVGTRVNLFLDLLSYILL